MKNNMTYSKRTVFAIIAVLTSIHLLSAQAANPIPAQLPHPDDQPPAKKVSTAPPHSMARKFTAASRGEEAVVAKVSLEKSNRYPIDRENDQLSSEQVDR